MSGTVSTRWFWSDWMSDTGLRACSYAARGLWKDLLCIAGANKHEYGFVSLNGRRLEIKTIAQMTNGTVAEVELLLAELELNGVYSKDRRGIIYCRRMVRAEKNKRNGRLGGNPNLLKTKDNQESVKPNPKALIPEPEPEPKPEERKEDSEAIASAANAAPEPEFLPIERLEQKSPAEPVYSDSRHELWGEGVAVLGQLGVAEKSAKSNIGRWLKAIKDDCPTLLSVIQRARDNRVIDPIPWITQALSNPQSQYRKQPRNFADLHLELQRKLADEERTVDLREDEFSFGPDR